MCEPCEGRLSLGFGSRKDPKTKLKKKEGQTTKLSKACEEQPKCNWS